MLQSKTVTEVYDINKIKDAILEASTYGILVIDTDFRIVYSNGEFVKLFNLPIYINDRTNIYEIFEYLKTQIKNPEVFSNLDYRLMETKGRYCFYLTLHSGKLIEVCSTPMYDGNILKGRIFIQSDVTERHKVILLEEQIKAKQELINKSREYDEIKNSFLNTISHEFKTPLTVIMGAVQLLISKHSQEVKCPIFKSARKNFAIIRKNCYRMIKLTNDLIDITKIESGFLDLDYKNQDIVSIIEDVTLSVVDYARKKNIHLVFDTDTEEKIIGCDADVLERIMLNLLSNAIKFTDNHGIIKVNFIDKGDLVEIRVRDNGIGIPQEKIDVIFDRFGLVDSSFNRQHEGSGIGLAIVKSLVEKHGGNICLNTEVENGSEFIISLPSKLIENIDYQVNITRNTSLENIHIEFSDIYELNL